MKFSSKAEERRYNAIVMAPPEQIRAMIARLPHYPTFAELREFRLSYGPAWSQPPTVLPPHR